MKKLLSFSIAFLLATSAIAFASDKETVIAAEKGAWQNIKEKKFDAFQKMLAKDFHGVYGNGINNVDKELAEVKTVDFKSVDLGEMEVTFISKEVVMVTYEVTIQGTEGGKDISGKAYAASVWKKDGNDWRVVFHTDVKAE